MCDRDLYDILNLIFTGLSAVGTIGAVIFSLWLLFDSRKIKYKMTTNSIAMIGKTDDKLVGVVVTLTSNSKENLIKIATFPKIKIKKNSYLVLRPNLQEYNEYKIPKTLSHGDTLEFFLDQQQIKLILKQRNKNFLFFCTDSLGNTYKVKIKRKLLEKQYIHPKE